MWTSFKQMSLLARFSTCYNITYDLKEYNKKKMKFFAKILFSLEIMPLTVRNIDRWFKKKHVWKIEKAFELDEFDIRKKAVYALGLLKSESSIKLLIKALDDKVTTVFEAAVFCSRTN